MTKAEKRVIEAAIEWDDVVRNYRWEAEARLARAVGVLLVERKAQENKKRVTHRSRKGPKLYPLRKQKSRLADIEAYKRGHKRGKK